MERYERQAREAFWMLHNMLRQGPVKEMDIFSYLYMAVNPIIIPFRIDQVGIYRTILDKCRWEETHPDSILWVGLGTYKHIYLRLQFIKERRHIGNPFTTRHGWRYAF